MTKKQWLYEFRRNLKVARAQEDVSQTELANRMMVTPQQIQKWESGKVMPSGWAIQRMAEALGCDATELIPSEKEMAHA